MPIRAGALDRRVTLMSRTVTQSDSGEEVVTWVSLGTFWAEKIEIKGAERFTAQQVVATGMKTFRLRWSVQASLLTAEDELIFDGRTFDIRDVREIGRREGIEIDAAGQAEQPLVVP